jgi:hypothetical protein
MAERSRSDAGRVPVLRKFDSDGVIIIWSYGI